MSIVAHQAANLKPTPPIVLTKERQADPSIVAATIAKLRTDSADSECDQFDIDAAQNILQAMMNRPSSWENHGLLDKMFTDTGHKLIFKCSQEHYDKHKTLPASPDKRDNTLLCRMIEERVSDREHLPQYWGEVEAVCQEMMPDKVAWWLEQRQKFIKAQHNWMLLNKASKLNKKDPDAATDLLTTEAPRIKTIGVSKPTRKPSTALDLWNYKPKRKALLPNVLIEGTHILLAAREKQGKTHWLLNFIADVLSSGEAFDYTIDPLPIVYLDWEMGQDLFKLYFDKVFPKPESPTFANVQENFLYYSRDDGLLPAYLTMDYLQSLAAQWKRPGWFVNDTVRGSNTAKPSLQEVVGWENKSDVVGSLLRPITDWCHASGWNVVSVHHHNKTGNFSGSTEFGAAVDAIWDFRNNGDGTARTWSIMGRGVSGTYPFAFENGRYTYQPAKPDVLNWIISQHEQAEGKPLTATHLVKSRGSYAKNKVEAAHGRLVEKKVLDEGSYHGGYTLAPDYKEKLALAMAG